MREILFRGFHPCDGPETIAVDGEKVKGIWVEGCYVDRGNRSWIYPVGNQVISKSLARELRPLHSAKSTQKVMREVFQVLPSTVGQYTGLTDRTGKRIFEGDILKTNKYGKDDGKGHNFAGPDAFCVAFEDGGYCLRNEWRRFNLRPDIDAEVIGTIFDEEVRNA